MKKVRLELDALQVETFDTGAGMWNRGTVHGRHHTFEYDCGEPMPEDSIWVCPGPTAPATCNRFTCDWTCGNTCSCGCSRTCGGGYTCTCPDPEPDTWDINVCP